MADQRVSNPASDFSALEGKERYERGVRLPSYILRGRAGASRGLVSHGAWGQVPVEACTFY